MSIIKANTIENLGGDESHDVATMGIESGSNANGNYTKFPDGTMICSSSVASSVSGAETWTYPQGFTANPIVSGSAVTGSGNVNVSFSTGSGPDAIAFSAWNANAGSRIVAGCHLQAIGRWK